MQAASRIVYTIGAITIAGLTALIAQATPPDGQVLYTTSFNGGVGSEWGSLAGAFTAYDSDSDSILDALRQTGGEACTLVYLNQQPCNESSQGLPYNGEYLNDYQVVMNGKAASSGGNIGVAVRGNHNSALTFQWIQSHFWVLKANAGGTWQFGTDFGLATNFIPGFSETQAHEYKVRALDGNFEFRVDGILIGTQSNPAFTGRTFDNSSAGTVGVAGFDPIIILDFEVKFIAGGTPPPTPPTPPSPKGQIVQRANTYDCSTFYLYVPSTATADNPLPLVITSHSTVTTADEEIGLNPDPTWGCCEEPPFPNTRWYQLAENTGNVNLHNQPFIVAAPALSSANGGLTPGNGPTWLGESEAALDEQRILAVYHQIVEQEATTYGFAVDTTRVMLTGWSGGGIPTYYVGVRHPEIFRMIVPRCGNWASGMFDTAGDLSALNSLAIGMIHGDGDTITTLAQQQTARDFFLAHGYAATFMPPADPLIRIVPDTEFPSVPAGHKCHSLIAFDTFMDYCNQVPVAPVVNEVSPDPSRATVGREYVQQLSLSSGFPTPTWSVVSGPSGVQVDSTGRVYGWTPTCGQINQMFNITIRASNSSGTDDESWQASVRSKADLDADGDVDLSDFGRLQVCYSGSSVSPASGCSDADLDADNDVDQADFTAFKACLNGTDQSPVCQ